MHAMHASRLQPSSSTADRRGSFVRAAWSGLQAATLIALAATLSVAFTPHARGVGLFPELRFGVVVVASVVAGVGAALAYRAIHERVRRPRVVFTAALSGLAVLALVFAGVAGRRGLLAAAISPALCTVAGLAFLLPRFAARSPGRGATIALAVLGSLEVFGAARAFSSERVPSAASAGVAFDVPRALFDVDHEFVDLASGARVHYVDEGRGDTLLFLHGNPAWSFQWRDLIRGLRGSYRCVALDYPGFGMSTAPDGFGYTPREQSEIVEEFVDHLGLRDVTLVMQDWGGPIGTGLAERRPELVRTIVLGNTWAWPTTPSEARAKWSFVAGGPVGELVQMNFDGVVSFGLRSSVVRPLSQDVFAFYERPFLPLDRRGVATLYPQQITAAHDYFVELESGLPRLADRRVLIFWGLEDPGFPRADLERWQRALPNHRVIELPEANHFFFEDAADRVIAEIESFASRSSAP